MSDNDTALRQEKVARYLALGHKPLAIAARLGISVDTVRTDVKLIQASWKTSPLATIRADEWMGRVISLHEMVISEAYEAWIASRQPVETTTYRKGKSGEATGLTSTTRAGDPAYLATIQKSSSEIAKLLGLYAFNPSTVNFNVQNLSDDQLHRLIAGEDPTKVVEGQVVT